MKRIIISSLVFMISTITVAEKEATKPKLNLEQCKEILGAALFNGVLEEACGFNGSVKDKLKMIYDSGQCRHTVPQKDVDFLVKDVLVDSRMRYKAYGGEVFCEENLKGYTDLMEDE